MTESPPSPFERNIAVRRVAPGRYAIDFDDAFMGVAALFGGVTMAASVRAAAEALDARDLCLRSASCLFVAPVEAGPAEASVRVLRRGRSVAHVGVTLSSAGKLGLETVAIFGRGRPGFSYTGPAMPDAPPPEACRPFLEPPPPFDAKPVPFWAATAIWKHVERRKALGHEWWEEGWEPTGELGGVWMRLREPPRPSDKTARMLVALALSDLAGASITEHVGPDAPAWAMTSADHAVHVFGAPTSDWLLLTYESSRAADGFVSATTRVWDQSGALVATASQLIFVFLRDSARSPT